MRPFVTLYCEGNDTKLVLVEKDRDQIKVLRASSIEVFQPEVEVEEGVSDIMIEGEELDLEGLKKEAPQGGGVTSSSYSLLNSALHGVNLGKTYFVPVLTEPTIYYHVFEGAKRSRSSKLTQEIIYDIQQSKNVAIDRENLDYVELADNSLLAVFLSGEIPCISLVSSLARYNGKRYYKIPSVKSAETSLAYYVSKRKKFFPDDYSLIVYIGKEYSKLIFLHGRRLKHIGATLDIGTVNLHTYDVYFSKILLEMENGGISSLDNIIVCGEDDSENLILSFYGTFPEANVTKLEFEDVNFTSLDQKTKDKFSSFSVPVAAAMDYIDELEDQHKGINLLPKYVKEDQKVFQFAWHGYAMLPLLFAATFFITLEMLQNNRHIGELDEEIARQTVMLRQNQEILNKITEIEGRISGFDQTVAVLDSATAGTGVWTRILQDISGFFSVHKNLWLTQIRKEVDNNNTIVLEGYALTKGVPTDFAYALQDAELKSVVFEKLRDKNAYKFTINFSFNSYSENTELYSE